MKRDDIDAIVIHCSATKESVDYNAKDIEEWHKERGFKCIGYNYVIDLDGTIEKGRPLTMNGAHCNTKGVSGKPYNAHSIGICYVGGLDRFGKSKDTRTDAQKNAMHELIYGLLMEYPIKEILGHRDASPDLNSDGVINRYEWIKDCPCFDVRSEFPIVLCQAKRKK